MQNHRIYIILPDNLNIPRIVADILNLWVQAHMKRLGAMMKKKDYILLELKNYIFLSQEIIKRETIVLEIMFFITKEQGQIKMYQRFLD